MSNYVSTSTTLAPFIIMDSLIKNPIQSFHFSLVEYSVDLSERSNES